VPLNWRMPQNNDNASRIKELMEGYKVLASQEKAEKERKRYTNVPSKVRRPYSLISTNTTALQGTNTALSMSDKYYAQKRTQALSLGQKTECNFSTYLFG
jgi:hypothetical protein